MEMADAYEGGICCVTLRSALHGTQRSVRVGIVWYRRIVIFRSGVCAVIRFVMLRCTGTAGLRCLAGRPAPETAGSGERRPSVPAPETDCEQRFVVLSDKGRRRNLASRVLGLHRLSGDLREAWGFPVLLTETFVDPSRCSGACYRASNWRHLSRTRGFPRLPGSGASGSNPRDGFRSLPMSREQPVRRM